MIVKVPIYFEVDVKLPPDQVEFLLAETQLDLTKFVRDRMTAEYLEKNFRDEVLKFKILTAVQVRNRIVKDNKPSTNWNQPLV